MWGWVEDIEPLPQIVAVIAIIIILIAAPITYCGWKCSEQDAILYNEKYGTHYTTKQFFWAGETIKSFLNEGK